MNSTDLNKLKKEELLIICNELNITKCSSKNKAQLIQKINETKITVGNTQKITIDKSTFNEIKKYYDETLNTDKSTYKSSNEQPKR
jgi:hypothetical protein